MHVLKCIRSDITVVTTPKKHTTLRSCLEIEDVRKGAPPSGAANYLNALCPSNSSSFGSSRSAAGRYWPASKSVSPPIDLASLPICSIIAR